MTDSRSDMGKIERINRNNERLGRKTERFPRVPIFSSLLDGDEVSRILAITDELTFEKGEVIFTPGTPNDGFYIIMNGRVRIDLPASEDDPDDRMTIATLSNRSVFGEMSFLGNRARSAWAVAEERTKLSKVRAVEFRELIAAGDLAAYKVIHNFARLIGSRLRRVESELLKALDSLQPGEREDKLAELQQFRQKLFREWSF